MNDYINRTMKEDYCASLCALYVLSEFVHKKGWEFFGADEIFPRLEEHIEPMKLLMSDLLEKVDDKIKDRLIRFCEDSSLALVSKASHIVSQSKTSFYPNEAVETLIEAVGETQCTFCQLSPDETRECKYRECFKQLLTEVDSGLVSNNRCPYAR